MSLRNISLELGVATVNVADPTPITLKVDGVQVPNGLHVIFADDADYMTRRQIVAKTRPPSFDAKSGSYSKDKKSLTIVEPVVDPVTGKTYFCTLRVEREIHPLMTREAAYKLNGYAAQLLLDSTTSDFWNFGTLD